MFIISVYSQYLMNYEKEQKKEKSSLDLEKIKISH
jgi:hypothetical protein